MSLKQHYEEFGKELDTQKPDFCGLDFYIPDNAEKNSLVEEPKHQDSNNYNVKSSTQPFKSIGKDMKLLQKTLGICF